MSSPDRESAFETELCEALHALGWNYSPNDAGYDRQRALYPDDLFGWLEDTQPDELAKVIKPAASEAAQARAREQLLDRIVKALDTPMENGGGSIAVLRRGVKHINARFEMMQPKPATNLNPALGIRYAKTRLRVMRQVRYSTKNRNSIDLVLFVNGIPTATLELKTDFKQSVTDAVNQYKFDRNPKGEPLLGFGTRALVHFAVSNNEVQMTTRLAGPDTVFLPFNRGNDGASGNPPHPSGSPSAYLWEEVLQPDSWLHILNRMVMVQTTTDTNPITGCKTRSTRLIFPRYHQWEAVTKLLEAAKTEGAGHNYLIQHSAGSGKTNTISWTAHGLASLHDENDEKVFQSVIIVTDRTVLDDQLQDAVWQIEHKHGVVQPINALEAERHMSGADGSRAKSALLAKTLLDGVPIVIVTIQTFPFALDAIRKNKGLAGKRFAVIADEAHSSQTGVAAAKLREVLSADEMSDLEEGGEVSTEDILAVQMADRADSENISYFAFTATPKPKTLQLFGREQEDGEYVAFHTYTMQQAIEEGFILDVLRNYTDYKTAYRLAIEGTAATEEVDQSEGTKKLLRWVKLHPTNISQKVQIIVEHYRQKVLPLIGGHAKAMVVTDSRKAAVRYKAAMDAYIAKQGYGEVTSLVAFSGEVIDEETGPEPFTERNMNPGLRGRELAGAFATDEYRVMIVANKFQTGFDQPLLAAMYVDKRLAGVTTVQTLSRLNRIFPGKTETFVLDFVNEPDDVLADFETYYRDARLSVPTDPNLVHELAAKLDDAGIYDIEEVRATVEAVVRSKRNNDIARHIDPARRRFTEALNAARDAGDEGEVDRLETFKSDVHSYIRVYGFMSQILDYGDTDLERRAVFLRLLAPQLVGSDPDDPIDLSSVELQQIHHERGETRDLELGTSDEDTGMVGSTALGSRTAKDPQMVLFNELVERINSWFEDDFSNGTVAGWIDSTLHVLAEDEDLTEQAAKNTEAQFVHSPDLAGAIEAAIVQNQSDQNDVSDKVIENTDLRNEVVRVLGTLLHGIVSKQQGGESR